MNKLKLVKNWKDAATLIICARVHNNNYKILMMKRSSKSPLMPNAYVYPGGAISSEDFSDEWNKIFEKNSKNYLPKLLVTRRTRPYAYTDNVLTSGLQPELAFRICALRETFEESGILLLRDSNGEGQLLSDPKRNIGGDYGTLQGWRNKVYEDASNFLKLFRNISSSPDIIALHEWSTSLTPTHFNRRYNAMFYICFIDNILDQSEDGFELVHSDWLSPNDALQNYFQKKINLNIPQIFESHRLLLYKTFTELKGFAEERESVGLPSLFCPLKIKLLDGVVLAYPGDDYHIDDPNKAPCEMEMTVKELRSVSKHINRIETYTTHNNFIIYNNTDWYGHVGFGNVIYPFISRVSKPL